MASAPRTDDRTELTLKRAPRQKLAETVAQQLLEAIRDLPPGTRVPPERELTKELGVGRSTVREALNGLGLMGVVDIRHGQGVFVADRKEEDAREPDALEQALMKGVTREFIEARLVVEVEIARLAAERRTDQDLQQIADTIDQLKRSLNAPTKKALKPATEFNLAVAEAAHNEVLAGVMRPFVDLMIERAPALYEKDDFRRWDIEDLTRIYEAIRDGDAELAARRMREHIVAVGEQYKLAGEA
jgi:GntR family transcriptional regulator, transcriptional repressor for pyruvate dehydrogenase complex